MVFKFCTFLIICLNSSKTLVTTSGPAAGVRSFFMFSARVRTCLLKMSYTLPELCKDFKCESCSLVHKSASFNGKFRKVTFTPSERCFLLDMLFDQCRPGIEATFEELIRKRIKCKVNFCIRILFQKINFQDGTVVEEDRGYMSVDAVVIQTASDPDYAIENAQ